MGPCQTFGGLSSQWLEQVGLEHWCSLSSTADAGHSETYTESVTAKSSEQCRNNPAMIGHEERSNKSAWQERDIQGGVWQLLPGVTWLATETPKAWCQWCLWAKITDKRHTHHLFVPKDMVGAYAFIILYNLHSNPTKHTSYTHFIIRNHTPLLTSHPGKEVGIGFDPKVFLPQSSGIYSPLNKPHR